MQSMVRDHVRQTRRPSLSLLLRDLEVFLCYMRWFLQTFLGFLHKTPKGISNSLLQLLAAITNWQLKWETCQQVVFSDGILVRWLAPSSNSKKSCVWICWFTGSTGDQRKNSQWHQETMSYDGRTNVLGDSWDFLHQERDGCFFSWCMWGQERLSTRLKL